MKNIFMVMLILASLNTASMAAWYEGNIVDIIVFADGRIKIGADVGSGRWVGYVNPVSEYKKEILTLALTAKTSNTRIAISRDGDYWDAIGVIGN